MTSIWAHLLEVAKTREITNILHSNDNLFCWKKNNHTMHCGRLFLSKVNHCISFFFKANTGQNDINGTEMYYIFHFNLNFKFPLFKLLLISEFCESCMWLIAIAFAYGTFEQNTFEQSTFVGKNCLCRMISFFHWKWNI